MMMIIYYSIFMFLMCMLLMLFSLLLYYLDFSIYMEWMMFSINSFNMEGFILIDWISLLFISMVLLISSMIMLYSMVYMMGDKFISRFIWMVILFIFSMILMIISPNIISILFGWDGLGLVSYCLVVYYQNYISYNSGMLTILCNRLGDIGILLTIGLMMMEGSWNFIMLDNSFLMLCLLMIAAITKSAQFPFSSWLPAAMAAPTPVSALVHSSTLVTAGVYMVIRFNSFFLMEMKMNLGLLYLSVLTMFMSGLMANFEVDLKKIIALSTLSQLGLMMMILSLGYSLYAFYHLLVHAIFKSLLFMCVGVIIHLLSNNQDIRLLGSLTEFFPFTMMVFLISNLALSGFPFMSGFYSKDLIMEVIYSLEENMLLMSFIVISLMFTVMYSYRLFYYLFYSEVKFYSYINVSEDMLVNFSMIILMFMSIFIGCMFSWMYMYDFYVIYLGILIKMLTLIVCMFGIMMGNMLSFYVMKNFYYLIFYFSSMWFLNYLYFWIYKPINLMGENINIMDSNWMEFMLKENLLSMLKFFSMNITYKMFMFMYLYISMMILFYIIY